MSDAADLQQRFVFIHIGKTAGTSIWAALGFPSQPQRTAVEEKARLGEDEWRRRFKFSIVRNPWDKVLSQYLYRVKTNKTDLQSQPVPFSDWVRKAYGENDPRLCNNPRYFRPQYEWLVSDNGRIELDYIGRFETLEDDYARIASRLGVSPNLPRLNTTNHNGYRSYYDSVTAGIIEERFRPDIELFEYRY